MIKRARRFHATFFGTEYDDCPSRAELIEVCERVKPTIGFMTGQIEVCPETGRRHTQVYAETTVRMHPMAFKQILGDKYHAAHVEIAYASQAAGIAYVTKLDTRSKDDEDPVFSWGNKMEQGQRSDLEHAVEMLSDGEAMEMVLDMHPGTFVRYHRGLQVAANIKRARPVAPRHVTVFFGPTGTGKTETAFRLGGDDLFVYSPGVMAAWFDGYDGQRTILLDEFRGQITWAHLLSITDKYPVRVQVKGSSAMILADTLIFTSPVHPINWYPSKLASPDNVAQLRRRVDRIVKCVASTPLQSDGHEDVTDAPWEGFLELSPSPTNIEHQFSD